MIVNDTIMILKWMATFKKLAMVFQYLVCAPYFRKYETQTLLSLMRDTQSTLLFKICVL